MLSEHQPHVELRVTRQLEQRRDRSDCSASWLPFYGLRSTTTYRHQRTTVATQTRFRLNFKRRNTHEVPWRYHVKDKTKKTSIYSLEMRVSYR